MGAAQHFLPCRFARVAAAVAGVFGLAHVTLLDAATTAAAEPAPTLVFGAAGDHGSNSNATAVLRSIGARRPDFFLSLGDLSYGTLSPTAWCRYVKENLNAGAGRAPTDPYGQTYPFALIEGNHERDTFDQYVTPSCLPDRLGAVVPSVGSYGRRHHVDVPMRAPLVRIIVADPGLHRGWETGSPAYQWLSRTIDGARAAGIPWVIVANHVNHISTGSTASEMGANVFDLLVAKKVDLILQGHDHTYQRSKQLALGNGCPTVPAGTVDHDCIVDDGSDGRYRKGHGPVVLVVGTGGRTNYRIDHADPDAGYFARARGAEGPGGSIYGYSSIRLTDTELEASFSSAAGASYRDSFVVAPK
jgi:hypothetical protein